MEFIDAIYDGYREKPNQGKIQRRGNEYLDEEFPLLSYIEHTLNGEGIEGDVVEDEANSN